MSKAFIYCHGLPGTPQELRALSPELSPAAVHALDRHRQPHRHHEARVLAGFDALGLESPVTVVGFSLGAMSAVNLAARRAPLVRRLILVSPAAPLELGDFLPAMAGRPVFEAARRGDAPLRMLTALQAAAVMLAPRRTVEAMFAKSPPADRRLLDSRDFVDVIVSGLRACLGQYQPAYRTELQAYVKPWTGLLDEIRCETEIWQGDADDWTPPAMAQALKGRLGPRARLKLCSGLGHYSTLLAAIAHLQ